MIFDTHQFQIDEMNSALQRYELLVAQIKRRLVDQQSAFSKELDSHQRRCQQLETALAVERAANSNTTSSRSA